MRKVIEHFRSTGVPEAEIPARVVELLGDVTPEEVRAVLSEEELDRRVYDTVREERLMCSQVARFTISRDEELARDIRDALRSYIQESMFEHYDADSDLRRHGRRLGDLLHAFEYALGDVAKPRL